MTYTAYRTENVDGTDIPVGKDGFVPEEALQRRYKEFYDGKQAKYDLKRMQSSKRIPDTNLARRDYMNTSNTVLPLECTPRQAAAWWRDPTRMDIQDIDAAGPPKVNVPRNMTREQQRNQGHIKVVSAPMEEATVRRTLVATYSPEDLHKFSASKPTVQVCPERPGLSGSYQPERGLVELDRYRGINQGTLAHEGAHHLRATDSGRDDVITTRNKDICIEESCTVAEQMARSDRPDYTGYYASVAVYDEKKHVWKRPTASEARRMAEEDHQLFTNGRNRGLKDRDALRSVKDHWAESNIARLRIDGNKMAVNRMADDYGNVERVSMAKNKNDTGSKSAAPAVNAKTERRAAAAADVRQTTLFSRRGR